MNRMLSDLGNMLTILEIRREVMRIALEAIPEQGDGILPYDSSKLDHGTRLCAQAMCMACMDNRIPGHKRTGNEIAEALLVIFTNEQVDNARAFISSGKIITAGGFHHGH